MNGRRLRTARAGLASLELVLVLPLLVFLAATIFTIGRVGLNKAGANVQARRDAWARPARGAQAERAPLPQPLPGHDVIRDGGPRGLSSASVERSVDIAPVARTTVKAQGRLAVLNDPLDHVTAPFPFHDRFTPDGRASRLVTAPFSRLGGVGNALGNLASQAMSGMGDAASKMSQIADQGDVLKKRRADTLKKITEVIKDKDLSVEKRRKMLEELRKELEDIKKAEEGLKDLNDAFGKLTGGS